MNKFERVLSDEEVHNLFALNNDVFRADSDGNFYTQDGHYFVDIIDLFEIGRNLEQAALAKLAEQEPVAWRVHPFDYGVGVEGAYALTQQEDMKEVWERKSWEVTPLYAHPIPSASETEAFILRCDYCKKETDDPWHGSGFIGDVKSKHIHACDDCVHLLPQPPAPSVLPASDKAACVSESGEIDTQIKERHRSTKNHIPNAGKMVAPHGYRLVSLADIDTAIQQASVFDDGGDGADPESARSCIEILKSMISSKAIDYLEPKKEVVHDRHTGRELLYIPPVGESLYSMAQARKKSFSLALSVDTKEVQALLQSYLDSLGGWQLVPKEPTEEMIQASDDSDIEYSKRNFGDSIHLAQSGYDHYKAMLAASPKYEGKINGTD